LRLLKPTSEELLKELEKYCLQCTKCSLRKGCKQVVFGKGNPDANLLFIGEGPGAREDELGVPFVGAAGNLFSKILTAVNISREEIYIANIVKCRPPKNRKPKPEEAEICMPYLDAQIAIIKPKIIVCMGSVASRYFLNHKGGITSIRGNWIDKQGIWVMPTFHPAALLRDASKKKPVWLDFQKIKTKYNEVK
jgi:DNA polymerase